MIRPTPSGAPRGSFRRVLIAAAAWATCLSGLASAGDERCGESLDPSTYGPSWIEPLSAALEREAAFGAELRVEAARAEAERGGEDEHEGEPPWELAAAGAGGSQRPGDALPAPRRAPGDLDAGAPPPPGGGFLGGAGTAPVLVYDFAGARRFELGDGSYPPDTCGAIGPAHFTEILNRSFHVYDRVNGAELAAMDLGAFLPGSDGDPRVIYDQHSGRWFALATNFGGRIQLAVSMTSDATGDWFKTDFLAAQDSDASCTVDYPTLGVDANGVYVTCYMVPGCGYTIFAIDKAPLLDPSPSLGTITAFRGLQFEGALQPAHTWGVAEGEYVVSVSGTDKLRVRRVNPPLTSPTLQTIGLVSVSTHVSPPNSPALGSMTPLAGVGDRLMNAVWRDGSLWTTHAVNVGDRGAVRWYEIEAATATLLQEGTVTDPERFFCYPSIAVNGAGDVALGFTGSSPNEYASAYFTGRLASDPLGETAPPVLLRAGAGPYEVLDPQNRNRWGDYSLTSLDPNDERTLWTVQEYAHQTDVWGTWIGQLRFGGTELCPDAVTYCSTSPNSVGAGARIGHGGAASVSLGDLVIEATGCPSNRTGIFFYGDAQTALPFGDGVRCVGGSVFRFPPVVTDFFGDATLAVDFSSPPAGAGPGALTVGSVWNFQLWYEDPAAGGSGFNLSDALELTLCP